jgi:hypothetical protein
VTLLEFRLLNTQRRGKSIALSSTLVARALVAPAAVLLAYGAAFASASLGLALIAFDDHPGQLYRLWHVVRHGPAPWAWNDGWWAGYPELQFYPPGAAYVGALLHALSASTVSVEGAYQAVAWLAYLLPGAAALLALARLTGSAWGALPGAFVALALSAGVASGVEGGVRVGMVGARLAWGLSPLLVLALVAWTDRGARGLPRAAVWLLAAIALTHPALLPAAVALAVLAAAGARPRGRRLAVVALALVLAAGLTAFWTGPLLARLAHTRALAWGTLSLADLGGTLGQHPVLPILLLLAALAARAAATPAQRAVARWPWVMAAVVAVDATVLEPSGLRWLPADRVIDGAWLAVVLAAGLAIARGIERLAAPGRAPALALGAAAVLAAVGLAGGGLAVWPRAVDWPSHDATVRGLRLDDLWARLAAGAPGRVLFLRSAVPLVHGLEWYRPHTHITALTPLRAGRPIVHGTFTHPSPVAALVYRGDAGPAPITSLAERLDGHTLFGRPLQALDAAALHARALGIGTIVALEDDRPRLVGLDADPAFRRVPSSPPFVVLAAVDPPVLPREVAPGRLRIAVSGSSDTWGAVPLAYYPLWEARAGDRTLETRRGATGMLEVRLSDPDPTIDLIYRPGLPEQAGIVASAAALVAMLAMAVRRQPPSAAAPATAQT